MAKRTAALNALQESQELFESFMNHSPVVAYIKDDQGRRHMTAEGREHLLKARLLQV